MRIEHPASHMDHMVRQTRVHLVQLSSMADMKANMLLTASSVVVTLCLPRLTNSHYQTPLRFLTASCLLTAVLAAWATFPRLHGIKRASLGDVQKADFNLLFFGDYSRLNYEEFEQAFEATLNDPSKTYEAQMKEIYLLGLFLARKKYRFVRWAYASFLIGILGTGLTALISSIIG